MKRYLIDWQAIRTCEAKRDQEIEALRQQISAVESRASEEIARHRADQAVAAAVIRDQDQTDEDVADLLEISVKQARQLITAARAMGGTISASASPKPSATPTTSSDSMVDSGAGVTTGVPHEPPEVLWREGLP
ncbi:hypothetical protein [Nocardia nepalensis]|uniref:hypothetical protein n=1 Tax=Nocardia nepalensis TaxID=3375448 RepID=UPI003B677C87